MILERSWPSLHSEGPGQGHHSMGHYRHTMDVATTEFLLLDAS